MFEYGGSAWETNERGDFSPVSIPQGRMRAMSRWLSVWFLTSTLVASPQSTLTLNLKGTVEIVDATRDTIPVSALSVALYSRSTLASYRAQPDQNGSFEMKGVVPGHYSLEMGTPSRLQSFTIGGEKKSPAGFELVVGQKGPMRIVLSFKSGALTADVERSADAGQHLVAILAPDDELLTLHSQIMSPVVGRTAQFQFQPPGKYVLFIVDAEFSQQLGIDPKLRVELHEKATPVEVVADMNTHVRAAYIDRQLVEDAMRKITPKY